MPHRSRVKIIATIGPSSWEKETLSSIIEEGVDIARINASFADRDEVERVTNLVREISPKVAVLLDTMGHKIRVSGIEKDIEVKEGDTLTLIPDTGSKSLSGYMGITYPKLAQFVKPGARILIDDGSIVLEVKEINGNEVVSSIVVGGVIKPKKTINVPNVHLDFGGLSEKDKTDIQTGIDMHVDMIALSFVRDEKDVMEAKELLKDTNIKIVAKIEDGFGVLAAERILNVVDAIMIARGDMGVELPFENIPIIQKDLIRKAREKGKSVTVATQMLESMKDNIIPTRAEISDVANAVIDGTDCVMLSAETSTGKHPVEAVQAMTRVIDKALEISKTEIVTGKSSASEETDSICKHVVNMTDDFNISGVIVLTHTGKTAISISRHRLKIPVYAVTTDIQLIRQFNIFFGIEGIYVNDFSLSRDEIIKQAVTAVYSKGNLDLTDKVAIISGSSIYNKSFNSILEIVKVSEVLG